MILDKDDKQIVQVQDQGIKDCRDARSDWERTAVEVELSYKGIKFPEHNNKTGEHRNNPKQPVIVNILKRQHRSIQNYFLNNEPGISVRRTVGTTFEDVEKTHVLLRRDFIDSDFYEEDMDDIVNYGMKRGVIYVLSYMDDKWVIHDKVMDSLDSYIDVSAHKKKNIRFIIDTFTKSTEECKEKYKTDYKWEEIDWDKERKDVDKYESDEKNRIITEPKNKKIFMFREGWYLDTDPESKKTVLVKVLSTKTRVIKKTTYKEVDFLPLNYYAPINDPDTLYNDSWYKWVLMPERIVNRILNKFVHIVETGGRYVYVREGTKLTKGKNKLFESLGIEVIEIWNAQEIPKPADLLTISQSQILLLEKMIQQAEEEWGMRQDIMGQSSLGTDASWRAIEALQAGSKGNVGMAMAELNKFMNRFARTHMKLYEKAGGVEVEVFDPKSWAKIKLNTKKLWAPKLHIEPRSAFDDIVRKSDGIRMLEYISKFAPDTKISAEILVDIFGLKNDLAEKIGYDIKQSEDPDIKAAEADIALIVAGRNPAVSEDDNHEVHMAMLSKLLESGKQLPDGIKKAAIDKYRKHEAFHWVVKNNKAEKK